MVDIYWPTKSANIIKSIVYGRCAIIRSPPLALRQVPEAHMEGRGGTLKLAHLDPPTANSVLWT